MPATIAMFGAIYTLTYDYVGSLRTVAEALVSAGLGAIIGGAVTAAYAHSKGESALK